MSRTSTQPHRALAITVLQAAIFFLIASHSAGAQPVWSLWSTTNRAINSVRFIDEDLGFFGGYGVINRTNDGGGTLSNIFPEYLFNSDQGVIEAVSNDTVWTIGTPSATIRWTVDGGQTWGTKVAGRDLGGFTWILDLEVANDGTAILVGQVGADPSFGRDTGLILRGHTDGEFSRISPAAYDLGYLLWDVFVTKQGRIWVLGHSHVLLSSDDNGLTWQKHQSPTESSGDTWAWHIFFLDDGIHGWLLSQRFLFRTLDGGESWEQVTAVSDILGPHYNDQWEPLYEISFVTPDLGWAIYDSWIYYTANGGIDWDVIDLSAELGSSKLRDIWFVTPDIGWVVGGNELGGNPGAVGVIFHTATATSVAVSDEQPTATVPLSVFPNPVSETAEIQFLLDKPTDARLEVFDILGRRVQTFEPSIRSAGLQRIRWDRGNLRPGVYLAKLATASGASSTASIVVN